MLFGISDAEEYMGRKILEMTTFLKAEHTSGWFRLLSLTVPSIRDSDPFKYPSVEHQTYLKFL